MVVVGLALTPVTLAVVVAVPVRVTAAFELLHVPPASASDNVIVDPTHTLLVPCMFAGTGLTVTIVVIVGQALI